MSSPLNVAVQMDPLEHVDINGDSTFALMLEAQGRGHKLFVYEVPSLALGEGTTSPGGATSTHVSASLRSVTVRREQGNHATFGEPVRRSLGEMDVVLMRQDPPFDMAYITATHLLDHVHGIGPGKALVVNDPRWVRDSPEKLLVTHFPHLMPPTLVTWDVGQIRAFRAHWRDIIVKPLFGNGGSGIFRIKEDDQNLNALLEMHFARSREPLMIQRYEPAVKQGDKRIILVDGLPVGAINRVPSGDDHRSNMHVGGVARKVALTERDKEICAAIGPFLKEHGLIFVGIDVIGDYLTEINVTSPTGLQELERFDGVNGAGAIWDCIEAKLKKGA
ncbi:glutathione synthase [Acetobacter tropicalis]|uniref:Glutathione synthetase n=1 Tax=Acetobacter tropicalis TaxID=104102 RepID=A0A094YP17_9PROT|nr:glutathione synthase [Acetobacter tropicalis]KAA8390127.1 glutathione synthase [Acetobacter tropicalis]KAA8391963.1 glutathione synthase [Acetobacter tropicalis]KGB22354.1 Glutathione synthetase [Acetobacter tropicalis]MBC9007701.1 glutathione synthase [Acetobacter tropicalis]MDO8172883.1 glutathione synthase [Acetobacter tropicalis]